jgi:methylated-DNA-[protein]-cysteine S-methyltransferase
MITYISYYDSPLGRMTMASDGEALTGLWFEPLKYVDSNMTNTCEINHDLTIFHETTKWLDIYFTGKDPQFTPPLNAKGTLFRQQVWEILLTIPFGQTMSYGEIAKLIACRKGTNMMSAQAVGGAVGHNPISLIIPCHRVIGAHGQLTGYASGIDKKRWLLQNEHVPMANNHL